MASADQAGKQKRTFMYAAAAFLVGGLVVHSFLNPNFVTQEMPIDLSAPLAQADFSWKLKDLSDADVSFSKYRGKTVFLNIWATWCGPCVSEMPSIAKLAADPSLKDVAFLCVSSEDSAEPIRQFITGKNLPMTMLRAEVVPSEFYTNGIPATFIINPEGGIVVSTIGSSEWDRPDVVSLLQKLEASKSVPAKEELKGE